MSKDDLTLDLVLKSEWFDKNKSGEKTVEYMAIRQYWFRRIIGICDEHGHNKFYLKRGAKVLLSKGYARKKQAQSLEDGIQYKIRQIQAGIKKKKEQTYTFAFLMQNYLDTCQANGRNMQDAKSQVNSLTKYFGKVKNILNIKPKDIEYVEYGNKQ